MSHFIEPLPEKTCCSLVWQTLHFAVVLFTLDLLSAMFVYNSFELTHGFILPTWNRIQNGTNYWKPLMTYLYPKPSLFMTWREHIFCIGTECCHWDPFSTNLVHGLVWIECLISNQSFAFHPLKNQLSTRKASSRMPFPQHQMLGSGLS